jgi:hypothetical protein
MGKVATVVSGRFCITMEGNSVILEKRGGVFVPNCALHSAEVVGTEPVVSVDVPRGQNIVRHKFSAALLRYSTVGRKPAVSEIKNAGQRFPTWVIF